MHVHWDIELISLSFLLVSAVSAISGFLYTKFYYLLSMFLAICGLKYPHSKVITQHSLLAVQKTERDPSILVLAAQASHNVASI